MKITKKDIKTFIMIVVSAFVYALAMKAFVEAGNLYPGGFSGLSRLLSQVLFQFTGISISFSIIYFVLNALPTFLVFNYVGRRFTIFSIIQFVLVSFFVEVLPSFPLTEDMLLIAVFGGILGGAGISIALRQNASSGGTDFLAIYFGNKFNISTWNYVMACNMCILLIAGYLYGWNTALYSIVYQFCSTQVVNTFHNRYKLVTLMIVTEDADMVSEAIFKTVRHGITVLEGKGAYSKLDKKLLYMTINAYQVQEVIKAIRQVDPKVFINISKTERIVGNYYQKPLD